MRNFSTKANRDTITQWLRENCIGEWEIASEMMGGAETRLAVSLVNDDDSTLYEFRWHARESEFRHLTTVAEPAFSAEELEAEPETVDARTYFAGSDEYDYANRNNGALFGKQMVEWCRNNLSNDFLLAERQNGVIVGVPDEDDRVLFMMKWENHPMVRPSKWEWSVEDV